MGRGATGSRGQLTLTFSGAGSTYGWCMNAANNAFKLSDQWIFDKECH